MDPSSAKRQHLSNLVQQRNAWSTPMSEADKACGFLGWHQRGHLPHCDRPDVVQFVTFRLADSMPVSRRGEWEHLLHIENVRERRRELEVYLDRGLGGCLLRVPRIAQLCEETVRHGHEDSFELLAWCVMPNHVHVLVHVWRTPLGKLVQGWKRYVATRAEPRMTERQAELRVGGEADELALARNGVRAGLRWQREYWDTYMRNGEQQQRAIRYIEANPVKAGLCRKASDWAFSSARFRDQYARLTLTHAQR